MSQFYHSYYSQYAAIKVQQKLQQMLKKEVLEMIGLLPKRPEPQKWWTDRDWEKAKKEYESVY